MPTLPTSHRKPWIAPAKPFERQRADDFHNSYKWRKLSKYMLSLHPLCACGRPAKVTDHVKRINPKNAYDTQGGRYGEPMEMSNLQTMCHSCHNKKSAKERNEIY